MIIKKPTQALIDFFEMCIVFTVVFSFMIGGGILFFRWIYWMVS